MAQESKRQRQVAEQVKRHFSILLQQEGSFIYGSQVLVTVTAVKMSPDLKLAKIYLSIFNAEAKEGIIYQIEDNHHRLQQQFYHRIRKHVRRIPELKFYLDDTLDEMYRLNHIFDDLGNKKSDNTEEE